MPVILQPCDYDRWFVREEKERLPLDLLPSSLVHRVFEGLGMSLGAAGERTLRAAEGLPGYF